MSLFKWILWDSKELLQRLHPCPYSLKFCLFCYEIKPFMFFLFTNKKINFSYLNHNSIHRQTHTWIYPHHRAFSKFYKISKQVHKLHWWTLLFNVLEITSSLLSIKKHQQIHKQIFCFSFFVFLFTSFKFCLVLSCLPFVIHCYGN